MALDLHMSVNRFYQIEQEQLLLEAEKVSLFTKHNPTIGSYREAILRDYIRKFIPPSLSIKSGFVATTSTQESLLENTSRQIDVLVYDNDQYLSLFETPY